MNGHRDWGGPSEEHQPVTYVRGYPVYAAHLVAAVLTASMIVSAIVNRFGVSGYAEAMYFASTRVLHGEVWRLFAYGLYNPPGLQFVIDLVLLVWFGREVERRLGRKVFLTLYAGIYLVTPVVLSLIGLIFPMAFAGATGALAVFTAFATLYPSVTLMFNILAKWAAVILIGTFTLVHFANHNEPALFSLWATNVFAFAFVRYQQGILQLPQFNFGRKKPRLRVLPDPKPRQTEPVKPRSDSSMVEIDALLDKIAQSGMNSLTASERAKLDAAREDLRRRSSRS